MLQKLFDGPYFGPQCFADFAFERVVFLGQGWQAHERPWLATLFAVGEDAAQQIVVMPAVSGDDDPSVRHEARCERRLPPFPGRLALHFREGGGGILHQIIGNDAMRMVAGERTANTDRTQAAAVFGQSPRFGRAAAAIDM